MKLEQVTINGFRGYAQETRVQVADLTALIGANDIGKSTILEALDIFFNGKKLDISDLCVFSESKIIVIGCIFSDFPTTTILDAAAKTTLENEFLLNEDGNLEIHKTFDCSDGRIRESISAYAVHPTAQSVDNLLQMKLQDLKKLAEGLGIQKSAYDARIAYSVRRAIRGSAENLACQPRFVPLKDEDAKRIWSELEKILPIYRLFKADRPSTDADAEVQDPMNLAVKQAILELRTAFDEITQRIKEKTTEVAERTIEKLRMINPDLAKQLFAEFKEPKWEKAFDVYLQGDNQIPINKRGSGTRRLVLLSFFRAESERISEKSITEKGYDNGVIYAIEEPETAQHPDNQKKVIEALKELSASPSRQVIITTHVPGLAELLPIDSIRYIERIKDKISIRQGEEAVRDAAYVLGVLPDSSETRDAKVALFVEGQRDVEFLTHVSATLHAVDKTTISIGTETRIVKCPVGGANLKDWVFNHHLKSLKLVEIHIYDRDDASPPKYQDAVNQINARGDGSKGFLTNKREMENYLHPDAIKAEMVNRLTHPFDVEQFEINIEHKCDVPEQVAHFVHSASGSDKPWEELSKECRKKKIQSVKQWLNGIVARTMTYQQIKQADPDGDIDTWLNTIKQALNSTQ